MAKKKKDGKDDKAKLVIRIDTDLRDEFVGACREQDTTASREVRRFIRDFLGKSGDFTKAS